MRVRLQYILVILLFVLTGMLCCQQPSGAVVCGHAAHSVRAGRVECRGLDCVELVAGTDAARQAFTLLALAELADGTLAQPVDQKAPARAISLFGHSAWAYSAVSAGAALHLAAPPPGGMEYYIYTLGKIRI